MIYTALFSVLHKGENNPSELHGHVFFFWFFKSTQLSAVLSGMKNQSEEPTYDDPVSSPAAWPCACHDQNQSRCHDDSGKCIVLTAI